MMSFESEENLNASEHQIFKTGEPSVSRQQSRRQAHRLQLRMCGYVGREMPDNHRDLFLLTLAKSHMERQVETLLHEALKRLPPQREAWLIDVCAGDETLLREVTRLVADYETARVSAETRHEQTTGGTAQLPAGYRLGPYQIVSFIAAGGMGSVYRAWDPRTERDVAIKVLSEQWSKRFSDEVRAVAALNHPNVCTLYDVGPNYLVMEFVDGESPKGPLPLKTALRYAVQIARALEEAHQKGIVHCDLKPGNIKVRAEGTVKVLDFGLAQVVNRITASGSKRAEREHPGRTIVGTAGYMSPEQAMGKPLDKRSDIWAFGAVLYEMVTGRPAFPGTTVSEVLDAVVNKEPDWTLVPEPIRRLLGRCLEKDANLRLRDIGDLQLLLEEPKTVSETTDFKRWRILAVIGVAIAAVIGLSVWRNWTAHPNSQRVQFEITPTETMKFVLGGYPIISPDGQWLAFPATGTDNVTRLWLRALDTGDVKPLAGTEIGNLAPPPFWSPDSKSLAFSATPGPFAPGQLKKIDISGGTVQTICDIAAPIPGGAWSREGMILFSYDVGGALMRIPAAGGTPVPVTELAAARMETAHRFPQFLPDQHHFLYQRASTNAERTTTNLEFTGVYVGSIDLKPGEQSLKPLMLSDRQAAYALTAVGGRLLFVRDTTLFAQAFDASRLVLSGDPVPIADQVASFAPANIALFSVSQTGILAYRVGAGGNRLQLTWFDTQGRRTDVIGDRKAYRNPAPSPDGSRVLVSLLDSEHGNSNLWLLDSLKGTGLRLTFNVGRDDFPIWSPNGSEIIFASNRAGHMDLYEMPADGSPKERLILKSDEDKFPSSWSSDGRFLLYTRVDPKTREDLWILPLDAAQPVRLPSTEFREVNGRFSPNAQWIAYQSDETGPNEIYVRQISRTPNGELSFGGKWRISRDGGNVLPRWRDDGREIFYLHQFQLTAVEVSETEPFRFETPKRLFDMPPEQTSFEVSSGNKFLFAVPESANTETPIAIVLNWHAGLK
jgi:eukaryotic-like serine/threonine-protein kinase